MTTTSPISLAIPPRPISLPRSTPFFNPIPNPSSLIGNPKFRRAFAVKAYLKENLVTGFTAAALTASMVIPDVADAADTSGITPSLKNFLLSIVAGGVVAATILGAVIAVAYFDPVKRT